jgi:hypothetical protein
MNVLSWFSTKRAMVAGAGLLFLGVAAYSLSLSRCKCAQSPARVDRWVLIAERDPNCYYGSSWNEGDLMMPRTSHDEVVRFTHQFPFEDGCTWQSTETLTPDGHGGYLYQYDEQPLSCREDAEPAPTCPMTGAVRVMPYFTGE